MSSVINFLDVSLSEARAEELRYLISPALSCLSSSSSPQSTVSKMKDFSRTLQDPVWVAKFQEMFGVEIIKEIENNKNHKWLPVEVRENIGESVEANNKGKYNIIFYKVNMMNRCMSSN